MEGPTQTAGGPEGEAREGRRRQLPDGYGLHLFRRQRRRRLARQARRRRPEAEEEGQVLLGAEESGQVEQARKEARQYLGLDLEQGDQLEGRKEGRKDGGKEGRKGRQEGQGRRQEDQEEGTLSPAHDARCSSSKRARTVAAVIG